MRCQPQITAAHLGVGAKTRVLSPRPLTHTRKGTQNPHRPCPHRTPTITQPPTNTITNTTVTTPTTAQPYALALQHTRIPGLGNGENKHLSRAISQTSVTGCSGRTGKVRSHHHHHHHHHRHQTLAHTNRSTNRDNQGPIQAPERGTRQETPT